MALIPKGLKPQQDKQRQQALGVPGEREQQPPAPVSSESMRLKSANAGLKSRIAELEKTLSEQGDHKARADKAEAAIASITDKEWQSERGARRTEFFKTLLHGGAAAGHFLVKSGPTAQRELEAKIDNYIGLAKLAEDRAAKAGL